MFPEIIVWPEATEQIIEQAAYFLRVGSPATAERWAVQVEATFHRLATHSGVGELLDDPRPRLAGVRVSRVDRFPRHVVVYRPLTGGIEVLRVMRGARDLRRLL
jgi:plasmid stabilization system protein ParE